MTPYLFPKHPRHPDNLALPHTSTVQDLSASTTKPAGRKLLKHEDQAQSCCYSSTQQQEKVW